VQGEQTDLAVVQPLLRDYRFRLIVDDGSHNPGDKVMTFLTLFPWLEPDAVYISAGFDEIAVASMAQQEQPEDRAEPVKKRKHAGKRPARPSLLTRHLTTPVELPVGVAWFAELGRALSESDPRARSRREQPAREFILRTATGVALLPGSVVVTN
jgi:hypothetical protein